MADEEQLLAELSALRKELNGGSCITQAHADTLARELASAWKALRPRDSDELLALVDGKGNRSGVVAPRWLCHLLALRHLSVSCMLTWQSKGLGECLVLQVRGFNKLDFTGYLGISMGGHVSGNDSVENTLLRELQEEMRVCPKDFAKPIQSAGSVRDYLELPEKHFFDCEWNALHFATLTDDGFNLIRFNDGEVTALYVCPIGEANALLQQKTIPISDSTRNLLRHYFEAMQGLR
ncbi:TPA: NUDIX domain-containing protein [Candidatus Micrarchaeota archaeon]|nr:NUDIX domain-containing protein [Candidatus Micrarchaeota archaeon]